MALKDPDKTEQMIRSEIARLDAEIQQYAQEIARRRVQRDELFQHLAEDPPPANNETEEAE